MLNRSRCNLNIPSYQRPCEIREFVERNECLLDLMNNSVLLGANHPSVSQGVTATKLPFVQLARYCISFYDCLPKLSSSIVPMRMGEWMSVLETPSPITAKMALRKARIRSYWSKRGTACCSERAECMDGDIARLDDIEGVDFQIVNQDLIEYIQNTF